MTAPVLNDDREIIGRIEAVRDAARAALDAAEAYQPRSRSQLAGPRIRPMSAAKRRRRAVRAARRANR